VSLIDITLADLSAQTRNQEMRIWIRERLAWHNRCRGELKLAGAKLEAAVRFTPRHLYRHAKAPCQRQHRGVTREAMNDHSLEASRPTVARSTAKKCRSKPLAPIRLKNRKSRLEVVTRLVNLAKLADGDKFETGIEDAVRRNAGRL
jgi:hypothetical protein